MQNIVDLYKQEKHPTRVLQFGEGNFLRAFVDYAIDVANEEKGFDADVSIVMPRAKKHNERFDKQKNLYTVLLRGQKDGKAYKENRVITCINEVIGAYCDYDRFMELAACETLEYVVSNTTEAGIVFSDADKFDDCPPATFPAKLTKFLFARYQAFDGAKDKGLIMLPVELIDHNGEALKKCVLQYADLWKLEDGFKAWLEDACPFVSTLVDRIVAGYPREQAADYEKEIGYTDCLLDQAEPFGLWVIGAPELRDKLPLNSDKLHVEFSSDTQAARPVCLRRDRADRAPAGGKGESLCGRGLRAFREPVRQPCSALHLAELPLEMARSCAADAERQSREHGQSPEMAHVFVCRTPRVLPYGGERRRLPRRKARCGRYLRNPRRCG